MEAEVLVQLSTSESSDEQDSDDITSSASCSGMSKSTLLSERGNMDSSSSASALPQPLTPRRQLPPLYCQCYSKLNYQI